MEHTKVYNTGRKKEKKDTGTRPLFSHGMHVQIGGINIV